MYIWSLKNYKIWIPHLGVLWKMSCAGNRTKLDARLTRHHLIPRRHHYEKHAREKYVYLRFGVRVVFVSDVFGVFTCYTNYYCHQDRCHCSLITAVAHFGRAGLNFSRVHSEVCTNYRTTNTWRPLVSLRVQNDNYSPSLDVSVFEKNNEFFDFIYLILGIIPSLFDLNNF